MKKKIKPKVLYAIDVKHKECDPSCQLLFYDIVKSGYRYSVRYYGGPEVYDDVSLDGAKKYILNKVGWIATVDGSYIYREGN